VIKHKKLSRTVELLYFTLMRDAFTQIKNLKIEPLLDPRDSFYQHMALNRLRF